MVTEFAKEMIKNAVQAMKSVMTFQLMLIVK